MANLLDISDTPRQVKTEKYGEVDVLGLSIEGIAVLVQAHPQIFDFFDEGKQKEFTINQIIDLGVDVLADFLAAGLGYPGDKKAVERCRKMNADDAFTIGVAIFEESFPKGVQSFFERAMEAAQSMNVLQKVSPLQQPDLPEVGQGS